MYLQNIDKVEALKISVIFVVSAFILLFKESIGGFILEKSNLKKDIKYPQILNQIENIRKLTALKEENLNTFAISNLLIDEKLVKIENKNLNLPDLSEILKNQSPQNIPDKKQIYTLQAVFISDKLKFAVINGRVAKEGYTLDNIKVLTIEDKKVLIQEKSGGKLWLYLNQ
ncbi:hypothetical protein [Sulfurihydrogenibium azorense]|uniref:hypothetical protein n=1 Tax=Sulfurihydrogenibium azorense TaxID=309806 RepID=UPI003919B2B7